MKYTFLDCKQRLLKEFEWLKTEFPLTHTQLHPIGIYTAQEYNDAYGSEEEIPYADEEVDAFLISGYSEDQIELAIHLIIGSAYKLDEADEQILSQFEVAPDDLFCWILYHEYGHAFHMNDLLRSKGFEWLDAQMEKENQLLEELVMRFENRQLTELEYEQAYRKLPAEFYADSFANQAYKKRNALHTPPITE